MAVPSGTCRHPRQRRGWAELVVGWRRHYPFAAPAQVATWLALGAVCGGLASIFWLLLSTLIGWSASLHGPAAVGLMGAAGLLIGLLTQALGDPGEIGTIVDNIHLRGGRLDTSRNPSMALTALLSIGTGGSLGPEAPLVQITGSAGTWLADRLGLDGDGLRSLSLAGMAAGFTALFGAPLGGALFALEILHHDAVLVYLEALLPALVASCASYLVFTGITHLGLGPAWHFPQYVPGTPFDFLSAAACALLGAAAAWGFIGLFRLTSLAWSRLPGPYCLRTTATGLLLGLLGWAWPLTRFFGEHQLDHAVAGPATWQALLVLGLVKLLATCLSAAGGWRGGFIIPLFFAGAVLGQALAQHVPGLTPGLAMVAVMAALNSAVTRTPISTTVLLAKLTASPVPIILFASLTGFFLAPRAPFIESQGRAAAG